jgi:hypothetical protein
VQPGLDDLDSVGTLCLIDIIEHLAEPQELLSSLSEWSLKHGEPPLVVSVPNVAHFDVGLRLLCGQWDQSPGGLLDPGTVRFFTASTLQRMFERCGWNVAARDNFVNLRTDQYDTLLNDDLSVEMVGALRTLSGTYNPQASVQEFVWVLSPFPVTSPPTTFLEAIGSADAAEGAAEEGVPPTDNRALHDYLEAVGLVSSETNRRAAKQMQSSLKWRLRMGTIKKVSESPRVAVAFRKFHGWLR